MNIVGVFVPKIISVLIILLSSASVKNKAILITIWSIKLIIDYDFAKPSQQGFVYKLVKKMEFENGELVISCIRFVPAIIFLLTTLQMNTWILLVPGVIAVLVHFALIVSGIKDIKDEQKRKNRK